MTFRQAVADAQRGLSGSLARIVELRKSATDEDIAELALALARSGATIEPSRNHMDVASTGGPTSLSTLIAPLQLAASGAGVPALAVPGRPAGGIDSIGTLPNYRVGLTPDEVQAVLARCRYAHFIAGHEFAPLDAELFKFRQEHGAQASPALAIASLLSKKIAVGVTRVALDVRVAPHGNFGAHPEEAEASAARFSRIAQHLGIDAHCWLTDATVPYQPWIGRGETIAALHLALVDRADGTLATHVRTCLRIADDLRPPEGETRPQRKALFANHLEAQGSSWEVFTRRATAVEQAPRAEVLAPTDGHVVVNLPALRRLLVAEQARVPAPRGTAFSDPAGLVLARDPGVFLEAGEVVALVRCPPHRMAEVLPLAAGAFTFVPEPPPAPFIPLRA